MLLHDEQGISRLRKSLTSWEVVLRTQTEKCFYKMTAKVPFQDSSLNLHESVYLKSFGHHIVPGGNITQKKLGFFTRKFGKNFLFWERPKCDDRLQKLGGKVDTQEIHGESEPLSPYIQKTAERASQHDSKKQLSQSKWKQSQVSIFHNTLRSWH